MLKHSLYAIILLAFSCNIDSNSQNINKKINDDSLKATPCDSLNMEFNINGYSFHDNMFTKYGVIKSYLSKKELLELILAINEDTLTYLAYNGGHVFADYNINHQVRIKIIGFGLKDPGLIDEINYKHFLIAYNTSGDIIDYILIAEASNLYNKYVFAEFFMECKRNFTVGKYNFIKLKEISEELLVPDVVEIKKNDYLINDEGKIKLIKEHKKRTMKCKKNYGNFNGLW